MQKVGLWICKIFIGLVGILLLVQGFLWGFMPQSNLEANAITVASNLGLNMIKSDIGAGLIATSLFIFFYLWKGKQWFLPLVIIVSGYLSIRIISFIVDGSHQTIIVGITLESLVLIAVLLINRLEKSHSKN